MNILLKPIVTEKMTAQAGDLTRRSLEAVKTANKIQIKQAIEQLYGVTVESVNTMRYGGKKKSRFTKGGVITGKANSFKKAIVTLADGEVIDFYSNI